VPLAKVTVTSEPETDAALPVAYSDPEESTRLKAAAWTLFGFTPSSKWNVTVSLGALYDAL